MVKIYTIGHSTRAFEEFLKILKKYEIELLIDVRRFPSSKKFPWFNKEFLEKEIVKARIEYLHYPDLGGFRKEGYENFSKSKEFELAIENLLKIIGNRKAAIMCAEILFFRCHRRYISEALTKLGFKVIHIFDENKIQEHVLKMPEMKLKIHCEK